MDDLLFILLGINTTILISMFGVVLWYVFGKKHKGD